MEDFTQIRIKQLKMEDFTQIRIKQLKEDYYKNISGGNRDGRI